MTDRLGGDPLLLDAVGALACAVLRWQRTLLPSCALSTTWRSFPTLFREMSALGASVWLWLER
jgi:hypothetical protein